jgi:murein L,D-transpeptidase YafK
MRKALLAIVVFFIAPGIAWSDELADRVIVVKSERKLYLLSAGKVMREMNISLGLRPDGDKQAEGDFRTPEGEYVLDRRNNSSGYFLSVGISYPNTKDRLDAEKIGVSPGGQIMIHGLPNTPSHDSGYYGNVDWTDGCIAVSNSDMVDVWRLTDLYTPISILP